MGVTRLRSTASCNYLSNCPSDPCSQSSICSQCSKSVVTCPILRNVCARRLRIGGARRAGIVRTECKFCVARTGTFDQSCHRPPFAAPQKQCTYVISSAYFAVRFAACPCAFWSIVCLVTHHPACGVSLGRLPCLHATTVFAERTWDVYDVLYLVPFLRTVGRVYATVFHCHGPR